MKLVPTIAVLAGCLVASVARAGTPESFARITPRAEGSSVVGLATVHGWQNLMYSKDGGKTFALLCMSQTATPYVDSDGKEAVRTAGTFVQSIIAHDGRFLVASFDGLWTDDGNGCDWQLVPSLGDTFVTALDFDPNDPRIIYGVTSRGGQDNGLFRRNPDGQIERVGLQEPVLYASMRAAALEDGGLRVYAIVAREQVLARTNEDGTVTLFDVDGGTPLDDAGVPIPGVGFQPFYELRYSDDLGKTWIAHDIGIVNGAALTIEAIDPNDSDRLVVVHHRDAGSGGVGAIPDKVLVSVDRGETFQPWLEISAIGGVSVAQDGTVFIGDRGEGKDTDPKGLWRAASLLDEPELIASYEVWCLDARADRLEVCKRFEWGTADPETGEFTEAFSAKTFEALHSCGGDTIALCRPDVCKENCAHWLRAPACMEHYPECAAYADGYSDSVDPDAGATTDAGATDDAGTTPGKKQDGGCGCGAVGVPRVDSVAPYLDIFCLSFVLMWSRRRAPFTRGA